MEPAVRTDLLLLPFVHFGLFAVALWPVVRTHGTRFVDPRAAVLFSLPFVLGSAGWWVVASLAGAPRPAGVILVLAVAYAALLTIHLVAVAVGPRRSGGNDRPGRAPRT